MLGKFSAIISWNIFSVRFPLSSPSGTPIIWMLVHLTLSQSSLRHILIKLTKIKDKEKILKAAREKKQVTYKGTLIRLLADFSAEILQARREGHDELSSLR